MSVEQAVSWLDSLGIQQLRLSWCDLHGHFHCKAFSPLFFGRALTQGMRIAGTLMLKDRSGRTALPVFDPQALQALEPELRFFAEAADVTLLPDLNSLCILPWASHTAWVRCDPLGPAGAVCPRQSLKRQIERASELGYAYRCGLEIEFHVYRLRDANVSPDKASWPGPVPSASALSLLHPGYQLLSERYADACEEVFDVLRQVSAGLDLPLSSLEIEMGPSQFEAVFEVQDALAAADTMALFRSAAHQALQRSGYYVSFCCRPPFPQIMSSGWHLHQSVTDLNGRNAFANSESVTTSDAASQGGDPRTQHLSQVALLSIAGLLNHTSALAAVASPSINAYDRYQPKMLAPTVANWAMDSRSALLRQVGLGASTRIENRLGEPSANPHLTMATQLAAMLAGIQAGVKPPPPGGSGPSLPSSLPQALKAFAASAVLRQALGKPLHELYGRVLHQTCSRFAQASGKSEWLAQEYFS